MARRTTVIAVVGAVGAVGLMTVWRATEPGSSSPSIRPPPPPTQPSGEDAAPSKSTIATLRPPGGVEFADRPQTIDSDARLRRLIATQIERLRGPGLAHDRAARHTIIQQLVQHADTLGDPALCAETRLFLAVWQFEPRQPEQGRATALDAFSIAETAGAHAAAAKAASLCVMLQVPSSPDWHHWVRTTELHIALAGGEPSAELQLVKTQGSAAVSGKRFAEALPHWQRAVELVAQQHGEAHSMMASALSSLSDVHAALGQHAEAEKARRRAIAIGLTEKPLDQPFIAAMQADLGATLFARGDAAGATSLMRQAVARLGDKPADDVYLKTAQSRVRYKFGRRLQQRQRHAAAVSAFQAAVPMLDRRFPENAVTIYHAMATSQLELGERRAAIESLQAALDYVDPSAPEDATRVEVRRLLDELQNEIVTSPGD